MDFKYFQKFPPVKKTGMFGGARATTESEKTDEKIPRIPQGSKHKTNDVTQVQNNLFMPARLDTKYKQVKL